MHICLIPIKRRCCTTFHCSNIWFGCGLEMQQKCWTRQCTVHNWQDRPAGPMSYGSMLLFPSAWSHEQLDRSRRAVASFALRRIELYIFEWFSMAHQNHFFPCSAFPRCQSDLEILLTLLHAWSATVVPRKMDRIWPHVAVQFLEPPIPKTHHHGWRLLGYGFSWACDSWGPS